MSDAIPLQQLASWSFCRVADAQQTGGNQVRLLKDGPETFPAWLSAINAAQHTVDLENYILQEDPLGAQFAGALIAATGRGVQCRVIYDWLGCRSRTSAKFWNRLRAAGVQVRCYNPPVLINPLRWVSRDHRKVLCVDGTLAFTGGLCIGQDWMGQPARGIPPWRDTAIEIRGPAVAPIAAAFDDSWAASAGEPPRPIPPPSAAHHTNAGVDVSVIAGRPESMGLYRLEQLVAEIATRSLWLTDGYFVATTAYVRALCGAARAGVDVRLLVPGSSNWPLVGALSKSAYRPLLQAGVRVFEWNGAMVHAKTAVADGSWSRIGSSNSNLASWIANRELDVTVSDTAFAQQMEAMFEADMQNATEVLLAPGRTVDSKPIGSSAFPRQPWVSAGRLLSGAIGLGSTLTASFSHRRLLQPGESPVVFAGGAALLLLGLIAILLPHLAAWLLAVALIWPGLGLLLHAARLGAPAGMADFTIISWNLLHTTGAGPAHVQALIHPPRARPGADAGGRRRHGRSARPRRRLLRAHPLPGRHHGLAAWSRLDFHAPALSLPLQRGLVVRRVCQILDFGSFSVANVHLSHGQLLNRRQLRRIARALPPCAAIIGDCNLVGAASPPGFQDAGGRTPTHRMSRLLPLRLDRCFTRGLVCVTAEVLARGESDHHPLLVRLDSGN